MKKTHIAYLVVSHVFVFFAGITICKSLTLEGIKSANQDFEDTLHKVQAEASFGHYLAYRDIARSIGGEAYSRARCNATLGASAMLDITKDCLADDKCRSTIHKSVEIIAPEIAGTEPLGFEYIQTKHGRKTCDRATSKALQ